MYDVKVTKTKKKKKKFNEKWKSKLNSGTVFHNPEWFSRHFCVTTAGTDRRRPSPQAKGLYMPKTRNRP